MLYLQAQDVSDNLRALFNPNLPASLRCFGVLNGTAMGEIICDELDEPSWGIVREKSFGTTYFGGKLTTDQMAEMITTLQETCDVLVGLDPDSEDIILLPPKPDYHGRVLEFTERSQDVDLAEFISSIPTTFHIKEMNSESIKHSLWYEDTLAGCDGQIERFFEHGRGFYLMKNQDILCEVYTTKYLPELVEMGVITHEHYRRSGYAAMLCAYVIQRFEQAGIAIYWNCAKQNIASVNLARKMGFLTEREYALLAWFKPKDEDIA